MERQIPNREAIKAALNRVLAQPEFVASPRICAFLRFVVEESLEGRGARLKAFAIATVVYGRGADFNPQSNPLVRVEALRLRRMLERYYASATDESVVISIPRGGYAPEFRWQAEPTSDAATPVPNDPVISKPAIWKSRPSLAAVLTASVVVLACIGGAWLFYTRDGKGLPMPSLSLTSTPRLFASIRIGPFQTSSLGGLSPEIGPLLTRKFEDVLSRFETINVISGGARQPTTDYQLTGDLAANGDGGARLSVRLIRTTTGEVVWSGAFDNIRIADAATTEASIAEVSATIAQNYGIMYADLRARAALPIADSLGLDCVTHANGAINRPSRGLYADTRRCLDATIARYPNYSNAYIARAFILIASHQLGFNSTEKEDKLELAIESAREGVSLAPQKGRAYAALFWARFFAARFDDAFESAAQAIRLNPYSAETIAFVGAARLLRGERDEGMALLKRSEKMTVGTPAWEEFYFFLGSRLMGDKIEAERHAFRKSTTATPLGMVARIISANEHGDSATVEKWRARLGDEFPDFALDIAGSFDRLRMSPDVRDSILKDLAAAGGLDFSRPPPR